MSRNVALIGAGSPGSASRDDRTTHSVTELDEVNQHDGSAALLALLLAIFLLTLPWFDYGGLFGAVSATGSPDGWLSVLALAGCVLLFIDLMVQIFVPRARVPAISSRAHTRFLISCVVTVLLLVQFIVHMDFGLFSYGFILDMLLAFFVVFFTLQVRFGALGSRGGSSAARSGTVVRRSGGVGADPGAGGAAGAAVHPGGPATDSRGLPGGGPRGVPEGAAPSSSLGGRPGAGLGGAGSGAASPHEDEPAERPDWPLPGA